MQERRIPIRFPKKLTITNNTADNGVLVTELYYSLWFQNFTLSLGLYRLYTML
jgi:hypothetical protein